MDIADIAISGVTNVITGGGASVRKLFKSGTKIAVMRGSSVITLELVKSSIDWKAFNNSDKYVSLFDGNKDLQQFFGDFVLGISGNVLPDEMLDIFKKWLKADFDVRWYATLTKEEKAKVWKIYKIIHSPSFKEAIETQTEFVKTFLQSIINSSEDHIKTVRIDTFDTLPEQYVPVRDNTNVVTPTPND